MGFLSCVGRLIFASFFLFTAWQEFNTFGTGGPKEKYLRPNIRPWEILSEFEIKALVAAGIALKGTGGILFVLSCPSPIGAYLLLLHLLTTTPVLHDFYRHTCGSGRFFRSLTQFAQELALFGALLFFLGMKKSIQRRNPKKRPPKSKAA